MYLYEQFVDKIKNEFQNPLLIANLNYDNLLEKAIYKNRLFNIDYSIENMKIWHDDKTSTNLQTLIVVKPPRII